MHEILSLFEDPVSAADHETTHRFPELAFADAGFTQDQHEREGVGAGCPRDQSVERSGPQNGGTPQVVGPTASISHPC